MAEHDITVVFRLPGRRAYGIQRRRNSPPPIAVFGDHDEKPPPPSRE
jgi:hypothetical protein